MDGDELVHAKATAKRIQQLCAEHGYNINSLARAAGVPPTTVKNIVQVPVGTPVSLPLNAYAMDWGFPYMISSIVMISEQTNQKKQSKRAAGLTLPPFFDVNLSIARASDSNNPPRSYPF